MQVLKKPVITEKANGMNESGVYCFVVDKHANKIQIKQVIEKTYSVTVESVRTVRTPGKLKTRYTKSQVISGRKPGYKKAYVQLAEGEIIDLYDAAE
jgi:large subunit ribosomal protein L23